MKYKKLKRKIIKVAKMDARKVLRLAVKFFRFQAHIRPRARLSAKALIVLILAFVCATQLATYIKAKEPEIKINGEPLITSQGVKKPTNAEEQITQTVVPQILPTAFKMPLSSGYLSQKYSSYHRAIDIATDLGAPIKPMGNGRVEFAGRVADGKGNIVIVNHDNGLKSLYAHMGKISVGVGDQVDGDTVLGQVGLTGRTTGAHLHLEIFDNSRMVDPVSVLPNDVIAMPKLFIVKKSQ